MTDFEFELALSKIRDDPSIMQQIRNLAATGAVSMEDAARATAHIVVALVKTARTDDEVPW